MINPRGGDFYLATSGDNNLAVDMREQARRTLDDQLAAAFHRLTALSTPTG
jgi:hypothetical protein